METSNTPGVSPPGVFWTRGKRDCRLELNPSGCYEPGRFTWPRAVPVTHGPVLPAATPADADEISFR